MITEVNWPYKNKKKNQFCQFTFTVTNFHINDLTLCGLKTARILFLGSKHLPFLRCAQAELCEGMRQVDMCYCGLIIIIFCFVSGSVPVTARGSSPQEDYLSWGGQYSALCNAPC